MKFQINKQVTPNLKNIILNNQYKQNKIHNFMF